MSAVDGDGDDLADADVDLRSLGAQALWLRGVQ